MKINFLGAAKVVTGSSYLIETKDIKIMIDCGMFQGSHELEQLNYENFDFDPKEIDYLILSHAHIDHSGRIPKLVKEGFKGRIFCTKATYDLSQIMLVDSGHIQESDVKWENHKRERMGKPPISPLYTAEDAEKSLKLFEPYLYNQAIDPSPHFGFRFRDAGHILGAAIIELWIKEDNKQVKIVFSGDLGMKNKPILNDPTMIEKADYVIMESTYGDRLHSDLSKSASELVEIINNTVSKGGTVVIPSFAVSRTQELIYELNKYYEYNEDLETFMRIPIYIDSPMAVSATEVYRENSYCFNDEAKNLIMSGDDPFAFENLHYVRSQEESMRLNKSTYPKVIISASGMCEAGRVRHHLKHNLWKGKNSVVFVGYQAMGTLGRKLKEGAKKVHLLGENIAVNANIYSVEGFSGHADVSGLTDWFSGFKSMPRKVFITHGEELSANSFAKHISETFGIETYVPNLGDSIDLIDENIFTERSELNDIIKRKENIICELQEVYNQFENIAGKSKQIIDNKTLASDYDIIYNKLLDLQKQLLDLNIILGN